MPTNMASPSTLPIEYHSQSESKRHKTNSYLKHFHMYVPRKEMLVLLKFSKEDGTHFHDKLDKSRILDKTFNLSMLPHIVFDAMVETFDQRSLWGSPSLRE